MRVKHKDVDFRISRRTLWIGMKAYPLHNVTRVQPLEYSVNHGWTVTTYLRQAGAWIGLGLVGLVILGCIGDTLPAAVSVAYVVVVLGMLTVHTVRLVRRLTFPRLYALSVATAGTPHAALVSTDKNLIYDLAHRVVDAIDNPAMEFAIRVDHIDIVHGDKYGGDKVEGDKIVTDGWS